MSNKTKLIVSYAIDLWIAVFVWFELIGSNIGLVSAVSISTLLTLYVTNDSMGRYTSYKDGKEIKLLPFSFKFNFKFSKK